MTSHGTRTSANISQPPRQPESARRNNSPPPTSPKNSPKPAELANGKKTEGVKPAPVKEKPAEALQIHVKS